MSEQLNAVEIPRGIDDPHIIVIWPADEMTVMALIFGIGFAVNHPVLGAIIAMLLTKQYSRFKAGKADGYLIHSTYWLGLLNFKNHSFKNPFIRRWFP